MKKQIYQGLTALLVMVTTIAYGQGNNSYDNRQNDNRQNDNRNNDNRNNDSRSSSYDDDRNYRNNDRQNNDSRQNDNRDRSDQNYRNTDQNYRNTDSQRYRDDNGRVSRRYQDQDLQQAYDKGYDDGTNEGQTTSQKSQSKSRKGNYQSFAFGLYGGLNATFLAGETVSTSNPQGRLGYQLGGYVRGGGRLFGQIGVEYMTSSSNIVTKGDGTIKNPTDLINGVDQRYIHIPAYIGVKLAQSDRGISAIRLQVGAELATVTSNTTDVTLNNSSINGLANLGFDAGPLTIDFVYHYGFNNTIQNQMVNYKPRILGINVGFKF